MIATFRSCMVSSKLWDEAPYPFKPLRRAGSDFGTEGHRKWVSISRLERNTRETRGSALTEEQSRAEYSHPAPLCNAEERTKCGRRHLGLPAGGDHARPAMSPSRPRRP